MADFMENYNGGIQIVVSRYSFPPDPESYNVAMWELLDNKHNVVIHSFDTNIGCHHIRDPPSMTIHDFVLSNPFLKALLVDNNSNNNTNHNNHNNIRNNDLNFRIWDVTVQPPQDITFWSPLWGPTNQTLESAGWYKRQTDYSSSSSSSKTTRSNMASSLSSSSSSYSSSSYGPGRKLLILSKDVSLADFFNEMTDKVDLPPPTKRLRIENDPKDEDNNNHDHRDDHHDDHPSLRFMGVVHPLEDVSLLDYMVFDFLQGDSADTLDLLTLSHVCKTWRKATERRWKDKLLAVPRHQRPDSRLRYMNGPWRNEQIDYWQAHDLANDDEKQQRLRHRTRFRIHRGLGLGAEYQLLQNRTSTKDLFFVKFGVPRKTHAAITAPTVEANCSYVITIPYVSKVFFEQDTSFPLAGNGITLEFDTSQLNFGQWEKAFALLVASNDTERDSLRTQIDNDHGCPFSTSAFSGDLSPIEITICVLGKGVAIFTGRYKSSWRIESTEHASPFVREFSIDSPTPQNARFEFVCKRSPASEESRVQLNRIHLYVYQNYAGRVPRQP
jgi:hypothetical protein